MRKLNEYSDTDIRAIVEAEEWDRPLTPVAQTRVSGWYAAAFWMLRLYVIAMVLVVGFAFFHFGR
jgi:anti-sigma-K factor RskA